MPDFSSQATPHHLTNNLHRQAGFSLTRFITTVAVLGLIFHFGIIPKFQQWQTSSRIAESLKDTQKVNGAVTDYYYSQLRLPRNNQSLGLPTPTELQTDLIESIEVKPGGIINVRLNAIEGHILQGDSFKMTPMLNEYEKIVWQCEADTLHPSYLPLNCGFR